MKPIHMRLSLIASLLAFTCSAAYGSAPLGDSAVASTGPGPLSGQAVASSRSASATANPAGKPKKKRKRRKKKTGAEKAAPPSIGTPASPPDSPRSS
jgi:hypothetical protein